ncbi:hypothetical protein P153DRAFT_172861 [Dothidotthia symphoricarpi CBS 119687]|uniref:Transcriptional regulatory protein DEP1 n=1 Tax=Dothidotthia symphoricarpi CBS 119687 TaxID=1392245 RepID=A0A6A6AP94_9PLEO|nr:uncharacterized protein P153DRAFT_172861 [Dothidotthia symphoricarpi CBS 119687]KAF2132754.1 hypothetical protein P153DRAFT_172861 [Dothidotthia symphoricarpi CBS 119687]
MMGHPIPRPAWTQLPESAAQEASSAIQESTETLRGSPPTLHEPIPAVSTILRAPPAPSMIPTGRAVPLAPVLDFDDMADNRSSSLSELGDASDDESEPTPRLRIAEDLNDDDDSEAETERLEDTPRKPKRTATDTSLVSELMYARTPSQLMHSKLANHEESAPPTPSDITDNATVGEAVDVDNPLHSLSLVAASEAASLEYAGKKRKRTSIEGSPVEEQEDEPARKRSGGSKSLTLNGRPEDAIDSPEPIDVEEELDMAEERLSQLAHEEVELEERQANIAAETITGLAAVAKHTKPRKGGRRGKRKTEDANYAYNTAVLDAEAHEGEGEGEHDEEDSATLDEEVSKKKNAIDELAKIEKKFKIFREKLCDEQIAQYERELEMLKLPHCAHPEYLGMIKCIDDRRAEKITYETTLLEYKQKNLEVITTAQRHQMHSQYFQTVRHIREDILEECNRRVCELQRGRRTLSCDETDYMIKLPEKRSEQIRHQTAYNLEVSVLSGVAKYVGFPAAPDISAARPSDIDDDLRAMKIATRPAAPAPPPSFRTYNRTTTADEAAAEEQFLESTPWANPRHPSHQESRYAPGPSRLPNYQTPAGQRRIVDLNATNGSASTIEANSNPHSSTVHNINGRLAESESPVLQRKYPNDLPAYEPSTSLPRHVGVLGREAYGMMSSHTPQHLEAHTDEQRWGGVRPLNTPDVPPGPGRAPMPQRNGLGIGSGLFGR